MKVIVLSPFKVFLAGVLSTLLIGVSVLGALALVGVFSSEKAEAYGAAGVGAKYWYFAEGYTGAGFEEWLLLYNPPANVNVIDKFPFSSDANATDVGDLTVAKNGAAGQSSTASGYVSGGSDPSTTNVIEKFSFSSDANATDVGDLTIARWRATGQQY